jgi:cell division protein FtsQ
VSRLRTFAGYVPLVLKISLAVAIGLLVFLGYRAAASASFFQVKHVETRGTNRASNAAIQAAVREEVGPTGVWRADLNAVSQRVESLPWVRVAVVTRVLPDGIRIRITEREPRAVVRLSSGRFFWVDEDAVSLGEMSSTDEIPTFFLRGWNEEASQAARAENKERVKKFLELHRDWTAVGLSERVSELNLLDLGDVRAQLAGDDSQIELRLGAEDQATRLARGLEVLDKQRQTARGPFISYIDMTQGRRAIVGLVSGARTADDPDAISETDAETETTVTATQTTTAKATDKKPKAKDQKTTQAKKASQKRT